MRKAPLRRRVRYRFDESFSRGPVALIAYLGAATIALIVVASLVVLIGGLRGSGHPGLLRQLYDSTAHALDTGQLGSDSGQWYFLVWMLLLTLGGVVVLSAFIGVITTSIEARLQLLRKGRSTVLERGHTLVLGWSPAIFTIVRELAIANESERNAAVVVLAERDKVEMEDALREKVPDMRGTRLVCRTGSPIDLGDLRIANPYDAKSIIVLSPESDDPDAHVIKTVLALTHAPDRPQRRYHIVAEVREAANLEVARMVGRDEAVLVERGDTIARIIVQASRQAGASVVYTDLLGFEGDEIYFREDPALAGRSYHEALLAYEDCAVIGIRRAAGGVLLNPPMDTRIESGDHVIAIAEDDSVLAVAKPCAATVDREAIELRRPLPPTPQRALVLGYNRRTPTVIAELDDFAHPGSAVVVVADTDGAEAALRARGRGLRNLSVEFRRGDSTDRATLERLAAEGFDEAIVMSDELDVQAADARTLVTLLHLRDIGQRNGKRLAIVSEMLDDRNRALAAVTQVDDVIVSEQVISLLLAQLSENVELHAVFSELFRAEGSEIYLRPVEDYVWPGLQVNFATLVEAAAQRGETAVGYRRVALADDPSATYGVRLNPLKSERFKTASGDRLILLAED